MVVKNSSRLITVHSKTVDTLLEVPSYTECGETGISFTKMNNSEIKEKVHQYHIAVKLDFASLSCVTVIYSCE